MTNAKRRGDPAHRHFVLEDSPFYLINRVSGRYVLDMESVLKSIGMDNPRWRTLMILRERNPSAVSEIAERSVMRLSTMTRVVQRLAKQGMVKIVPSRCDRRKTNVALTAKGRDAVERVRQVASQVYSVAFRDFSPAEIQRLNSYLARLFNNLAAHGAANDAND